MQEIDVVDLSWKNTNIFEYSYLSQTDFTA